MTMTDIPGLLVTEGGDARAEFVQDLVDLAAFYATHPAVPLPGDGGRVHVQIRVPGDTRGQKVSALDDIATLLGVPLRSTGHGGLTASHPFRRLALTASLDPEGSAHLIARQDALRAAEASGSAA